MKFEKKRTRLFPSIEQSVRKQERGTIFDSFVPDAGMIRSCIRNANYFLYPCSNRVTFNVCAPARISWHEAENLMPHFLANHRITPRRQSHLVESSSQTIAKDRRER